MTPGKSQNLTPSLLDLSTNPLIVLVPRLMSIPSQPPLHLSLPPISSSHPPSRKTAGRGVEKGRRRGVKGAGGGGGGGGLKTVEYVCE